MGTQPFALWGLAVSLLPLACGNVGAAHDDTPDAHATPDADLVNDGAIDAQGADAGGAELWCPLPGCAASTLPAGADLYGVWAGPAGEVWVIGESGHVGRRAPDANGAAWCWCAPAPTATMRAVWGSSDRDVWMVGDGGNVIHFDGATFSNHQVGTTSALNAVWGSAADDVFVVGEGGVARHFNGATWSSSDVGAEHSLRGVWGASPTAVWAVGRIPVDTPSGGDGPPYHGAEAEVFRWDAARNHWTREAAFLQERGAAGFEGIDGSGATDVWAVGHNFPQGAADSFAFAVHFDGAHWTPAPAPSEAIQGRDYTDAEADAPGVLPRAWFAAAGNTAVRCDGNTWTPADPSTKNLLALDARSGQVWAAGRDGKVMRRDDAGWVTVLPPTTPIP